ncbi:MAG: FHA domain-containing protein [Chloroflexi bacterium]|nr:FHA domain-containing protein [Chloroflexota bacterium]
MTAQYQLVMHSGPTPGKTFPLEGDIITIGREAENGIVINDAEVSRKHTQFVFQGGKFILTDLGSTNGTFVNGQRLTGQHVLQPGEVISLGEQINLLFESIVQVDPNATMLSTSRPPAPLPRPEAAAIPAAKPALTPAPVYAGKVPAGPSPLSAPAPAKAGNSRIALIIIGVVLLCLVCSCAGILYYVDANSLWCSYAPFIPGCGG